MGLENLIEAMPDIVRAIPDVQLVIGGTGPLKEPLLQLSQTLGMENHIRFAGFIPEEDLPTFFGAADAFILPTIALEGFGLVTVEALASGTPALGTPVGGTIEILRDLGPDFLFRDTSPGAMSSLIIKHCKSWLQDPETYATLCRHCRHYAETRYSWQRNIETTERLFKSF